MLTTVEQEIIYEMAKNNLRISETGRQMYYHRKSIEYHCERIEEKTGLNPRVFYDEIKLLKMIGEEIR